MYSGSTINDIIANPAYGDGTQITIDAKKFAAFYYDLNNNVTTESLSIKNVASTSGTTIGAYGIVYSTTIQQTPYKYTIIDPTDADWGTDPVLGFFGDKYVPLKLTDASKLAKLVLDSNDKYALKKGEKLDLGHGYNLQVKQIDVYGKRVWLEFDKDGKYVDDQIVSVDVGQDHTWTCRLDKIQGEDNVPVLKVHVNQVFPGTTDDIVQFEGMWLIDYANALKIDASDEFGKLNDVSINGPTINLANKDTFTLTRDSDQEIGQGLYFKVADSNALRYYPYITLVIGENDSKILPVADFSTNVTSGYAPLSVQFTDHSQNADRGNWDFGDGNHSIDQNPSHTYSVAGTYTVNLIVSNADGTSSKTATITVQVQSSSSGDSNSGDSKSGGSSGGSSQSGGGGGAGGSPEPQSNVEAKELSQTFIASGKAVKFDFSRNNTSVVYVSFDSKKTAGKTTTIAEMLKGKSTLVSGLPADETYKHLSIWVGNGGFATSKNIEKAVICFKVEKSWIKDKKIDISSITLNRYSEKKWNQLPTSLLSEDDKYLYFTAQTPGFSPFAIAGKRTATGTEIQSITETKAQPAAVNETQTKTNTGTTAANTQQSPEKKESASTLGFEIVCGIISLLGVVLYKRK